jgi:hypothetical protein
MAYKKRIAVHLSILRRLYPTPFVTLTRMGYGRIESGWRMPNIRPGSLGAPSFPLPSIKYPASAFTLYWLVPNQRALARRTGDAPELQRLAASERHPAIGNGQGKCLHGRHGPSLQPRAAFNATFSLIFSFGMLSV